MSNRHSTIERILEVRASLEATRPQLAETGERTRRLTLELRLGGLRRMAEERARAAALREAEARMPALAGWLR